MAEPSKPVLATTAGDFTLQEYRLRGGGREWTAWHTGAVLTADDERRVIGAVGDRLPYGVALWPSAIALAHEVATRGDEFAGRAVLELGAGTGLPGIVAATLGAKVTQTDRDELALHLCRRNGERNDQSGIDCKLADWTAWPDLGRFDLVLGADILYGESLHPEIRRILEATLAPGGRVLLSDPFRPMSLRFLGTLEADGWSVSFNRWEVGEDDAPRSVGVFELIPPA